MFKNYFKIAWRNLFRNKGFSITNILGLTIGITCTILIFLWVQDERTYDKFQKNYDNIYQVMANRDFKNNIFTDPNMVLPLASSLEKAYPQIKNAVVTTQDERDIFSYQDSKLKKTGLTVGGDFFDIFSGLAIFICCIGLAGLASFTIEKRIREIGIRKVLGSSIQQILFLISKEFLKLVFIAFVIAVPLTWWAMNSWLQKYEYRIHISIWLFAAVGFLILLLTLTVVSLNTLRAARANPVKSLRTE